MVASSRQACSSDHAGSQEEAQREHGLLEGGGKNTNPPFPGCFMGSAQPFITAWLLGCSEIHRQCYIHVTVLCGQANTSKGFLGLAMPLDPGHIPSILGMAIL